MEDGDVREIENEFKRHPNLSVNLLRLVNSAAMGRAQSVTSLRHALVLLGRRQLRIWLQLFHVQPRTELLHRAEAAIHHQQDCRLKLLFGRYAFVFEASSPALGKLIE